jgi:hypothetical protein
MVLHLLCALGGALERRREAQRRRKRNDMRERGVQPEVPMHERTHWLTELGGQPGPASVMTSIGCWCPCILFGQNLQRVGVPAPGVCTRSGLAPKWAWAAIAFGLYALLFLAFWWWWWGIVASGIASDDDSWVTTEFCENPVTSYQDDSAYEPFVTAAKWQAEHNSECHVLTITCASFNPDVHPGKQISWLPESGSCGDVPGARDHCQVGDWCPINDSNIAIAMLGSAMVLSVFITFNCFFNYYRGKIYNAVDGPPAAWYCVTWPDACGGKDTYCHCPCPCFQCHQAALYQESLALDQYARFPTFAATGYRGCVSLVLGT